MIKILGGSVALLGIVSSGAAQCARVFASTAWVLLATDWTVPCIAIAFAGPADPRTGGFLSREETGGTV